MVLAEKFSSPSRFSWHCILYTVQPPSAPLIGSCPPGRTETKSKSPNSLSASSPFVHLHLHQQCSHDNPPTKPHNGSIHPPHRLPLPALPPAVLLPRPPRLGPLENEANALLHRSHHRMPRLPRPADLAESSFRAESCGKGEAGRIYQARSGEPGQAF